jgi:hypothetical protein
LPVLGRWLAAAWGWLPVPGRWLAMARGCSGVPRRRWALATDRPPGTEPYADSRRADRARWPMEVRVRLGCWPAGLRVGLGCWPAGLRVGLGCWPAGLRVGLGRWPMEVRAQRCRWLTGLQARRDRQVSRRFPLFLRPTASGILAVFGRCSNSGAVSRPLTTAAPSATAPVPAWALGSRLARSRSPGTIWPTGTVWAAPQPFRGPLSAKPDGRLGLRTRFRRSSRTGWGRAIAATPSGWYLVTI